MNTDRRAGLTAEDLGLTQALYSTTDFAKLANRGRSWVFELIREKKVGIVRMNGRTYIPRSDALALINAGYEAAAPAEAA